MEFANPVYLYLLLIIPLLIVWYIFKNNKSFAEIQFSSFSPFKNVKKTLKQRMYHLLFVLRLLVISLLIIVLARPQSSLSKRNVSIEGIDIVLAYDISSSMLAEDFKPNRLEAGRDVGLQFINGRPNDRIGLVIFSGEAFTQCPLTSDHGVLKNLFLSVKTGIIEDGTALGDGLATAVSRIKDSKAISKVIILMTDGVSNMGSVDPLSAADIAKLFGIRVYTIGIGTTGVAPYPFKTPFGIQYQNMEVKIDEALLKQISKTTNGNYYRATSKTKLENIFNEIDKLEKSKIDVTEFHKKSEEFLYFILLAAFLLIVEIIVRYTFYRTIP
ncbi:MAG: VWA domain-containing protein [Bacteroidetes bacterium]|nr:VWA domain-containing protein [Bacteroidota bacterium]